MRARLTVTVLLALARLRSSVSSARPGMRALDRAVVRGLAIFLAVGDRGARRGNTVFALNRALARLPRRPGAIVGRHDVDGRRARLVAGQSRRRATYRLSHRDVD